MHYARCRSTFFLHHISPLCFAQENMLQLWVGFIILEFSTRDRWKWPLENFPAVSFLLQQGKREFEIQKNRNETWQIPNFRLLSR